MSNNPLLPIFRLLPSPRLRYMPIRPLGPTSSAPRSTSSGRTPPTRAVQRVRTTANRDTNQIPS
jgi:hypothetical protein